MKYAARPIVAQMTPSTKHMLTCASPGTTFFCLKRAFSMLARLFQLSAILHSNLPFEAALLILCSNLVLLIYG